MTWPRNLSCRHLVCICYICPELKDISKFVKSAYVYPSLPIIMIISWQLKVELGPTDLITAVRRKWCIWISQLCELPRSHSTFIKGSVSLRRYPQWPDLLSYWSSFINKVAEWILINQFANNNLVNGCILQFSNVFMTLINLCIHCVSILAFTRQFRAFEFVFSFENHMYFSQSL